MKNQLFFKIFAFSFIAAVFFGTSLIADNCNYNYHEVYPVCDFYHIPATTPLEEVEGFPEWNPEDFEQRLACVCKCEAQCPNENGQNVYVFDHRICNMRDGMSCPDLGKADPEQPVGPNNRKACKVKCSNGQIVDNGKLICYDKHIPLPTKIDPIVVPQ